jgi:hypothetical protein
MARDIDTEPEGFDLDTPRNLGPPAPLAGVWEGQGTDTLPVAEDERCHLHVDKLDEPLTLHDQVALATGRAEARARRHPAPRAGHRAPDHRAARPLPPGGPEHPAPRGGAEAQPGAPEGPPQRPVSRSRFRAKSR